MKQAVQVISVRENPAYTDIAIQYISDCWPSVPTILYKDSIEHAVHASGPLPQWYLLEKYGIIVGCAGLITNDFVSRMDLWPWLCALYIDEMHRGNRYSALLIERAKADAADAGFGRLYLTTSHIGLYEKYGFSYIGQGYHPWNEESRIYEHDLTCGPVNATEI